MLDGLLGEGTAEQLFSQAQGLALPFACLALYFGLFFGFLSRRFERQADIFGCRVVSCGRADCPPNHAPDDWSRSDPPLCPEGVQIFVRALEKIADLNGAMRDARSWRHFSIAKRVDFLQQLATKPEIDRRFQRVVLLLKVLVIVALASGAWSVWHHSADTARELLSW